MRVLVTGGAGFIGSQVVEALLARGHEPVVFDALLPSAHPEPPPPHPAVRRIVADVRDRAAVDEALRGVHAVCHQAAMVGLGKDFADAPDYVGCNDLGTAVLLAAMAAAGVGSLVLAGSMVVYGEGRYACPRHGVVRPGPRAEADLAAGRFEPHCPALRRRTAPGAGRARTRRPIRATSTPRPSSPRSIWPPPGRAPPAAGPSRCATTTSTGPGCRATPRTRAWRRSSAPRWPGARHRWSTRTAASGGTSSTSATSRPPTRWRWKPLPDREAGTLTAYNTGSGVPHTVGEMARALAEACGGPAPVVTGEYRLGDVRHITASSRRIADELGWRAQVDFASGMEEFARDGMRAGAPTSPRWPAAPGRWARCAVPAGALEGP